MKRKIMIAFLACLMLSCTLSGCTVFGGPDEDILQVSDRMFVHLMGIEEDDGLCLLTLQTYDISSADGENISDTGYKAVMGSGRSFAEARDSIELVYGKRLYFGSCEAVICDSDILLSKNALNTLISKHVPTGCRVFLSDDPSGFSRPDEDEAPPESSRADRFLESCRYLEEGGVIAPVTLLEAYTAAVENSRILVPRVKKGICGSAAAGGSSQNITVLNAAESAAVGLMKGRSGVKLSAGLPFSSAAITVQRLEPVYYVRTGSDKRVCTVTFTAVCKAEEMPLGTTHEEAEKYAAEVLENAVEGICRDAYENKYMELFAEGSAAEILSDPAVPAEFQVSCGGIKLIT
ncbi:MAG: hypothetical protein ACI4KF_05630 [Huintestinicola sp.]